jgi:hypothetical protein
MENQLQKLKINATNIKSTLIFSNKELKKTRIKKKELIQKIENKNKVQSEEKRLESKNLGVGSSIKNIASIATSPIKSFFDRILEFFGLIALNILIQELPAILEKIENFMDSDFMKTVGNIFNTIGTGISKIGELFGILPQSKMDEIDEDLKEIEKDIDSDDKSFEDAEKDFENLDKKLKSEEDYEPEEIEEQPTPLPEISEEPKTQEKSEPASQIQPQKPQDAPGPVPVSETTKSEDPKPQKFSRGGTVKSTDSEGKPRYTPKESGRLSSSKRSLQNGFLGFDLAVKTIKESTEREEQNMISLSKVSKKLFEWGTLMQQFGGGGTGGQYGGGPNSYFGSGAIGGDEEELLFRLMHAEAGGEGKLGMAMVARSVLNRAGLVQSGRVPAGTFLSNSGSIADIIYGTNQYQPVREGKLENNLSESQRSSARAAYLLAKNPESLKSELEKESISDRDIQKLISSTGFRTHSADYDASQHVNSTRLGGHQFNTAGNTGMLTVSPEVSTGLGDFEGNVISVGKMILDKGFTIGENKYFTKNNWSKQGPNTGGFNQRGDSYVGNHASADHATNALDITDHRGSAASGVPRLKNLFLSLYGRRQQYGIKALIYDPIGHWFSGMEQYNRERFGGHPTHLHVGFTVSADVAMRRESSRKSISEGSSSSYYGPGGKPDVVIVRQTVQNDRTVPVPIPVTQNTQRAQEKSQRLTSIWLGK